MSHPVRTLQSHNMWSSDIRAELTSSVVVVRKNMLFIDLGLRLTDGSNEAFDEISLKVIYLKI